MESSIPEQPDENVVADAPTDVQLEIIEKRKASSPLLQNMAMAADAGDAANYFKFYGDLINIWTPEENKTKGESIPPWLVPGGDQQLVLIHSMQALIIRTLMDAGVFQVAAAKKAQQNSTGLTDASGRLIA